MNKLSLFEIYYDSNQKKYKQKTLRTRPTNEYNILNDELRQFKESVKNRKGIDFVIGRQGQRFRL